MNADLVRYIDSIHRDRGIDKEVLFLALEEALISAIKKRYDLDDDFELHFDRQTGKLESNYEIQFEELGRIFAQTVKQTWFTKIREAERDVIFNEYEGKRGDIVTGTVQRFEGDTVIVSLGKFEGIMPRPEKVRGESYHIGERIRAVVLDVKKVGLKVKIVLSRSSTAFVRRLFELEVPEIAEGIIEIRKIERDPGYRTKIAVSSSDPRVDCVGACVGVRGTRIKSIIDELGGERIDIIRWTENPEQMLINALQPAEVSHIQLDHVNRKALVLVEEDQLSLAIGRRGQNVWLASKLTGWEINIMTRAELEKTLEEDDAREGGGEAGAPEETASSAAGALESGDTARSAESAAAEDARGSETDAPAKGAPGLPGAAPQAGAEAAGGAADGLTAAEVDAAPAESREPAAGETTSPPTESSPENRAPMPEAEAAGNLAEQTEGGHEVGGSKDGGTSDESVNGIPGGC